MNFKLKNKRYLTKLEKLLEERRIRQADENGVISFTAEEVYYIARASGLRTNKTRKIVKRFQLIMGQAIRNMVKELDGKNQN